MITIQELADILTAGLNDNTMGIKFSIGADVATYRKLRGKPVYTEKPTCGIIRFISGKFQPVKDLNNVDTIVVLELLAAQENLPKIEQILMNYISVQVGETADIGGYQAVINFDVPTVGTAKNDVVGSGVPIQVMAYYNLIQNAFYSNQVQVSAIMPNGTVVPLKPLSLEFGKSGEHAAYQPLGTRRATEIISQTSFNLSMTLPVLNDDFHKNVVNDILQENYQNKTYQLRLTLRNVFESVRNYLLETGTVQLPPGELMLMQCSFILANAIVGG